MSLISFVRPATAGLLAAALAGCGQGVAPSGGEKEVEGRRFEALARSVAEIELQPQADQAPPSRLSGLRPAFAPLKVELMTPHELWDARDGVGRIGNPAPETPAPSEPPAAPPAAEGRMIQLGAYASEAEARRAWGRLADSEGLAGLSPILQVAEVGGRRWVRLRVGPVPADRAEAVCAAAGVDDPWCRTAA